MSIPNWRTEFRRLAAQGMDYPMIAKLVQVRKETAWEFRRELARHQRIVANVAAYPGKSMFRWTE